MALTNAVTGLPINREDSLYKKFADQYLDLADQGLIDEVTAFELAEIKYWLYSLDLDLFNQVKSELNKL